MSNTREEFLESEEFKELKTKFPDQLKEMETLIDLFFKAAEEKKAINLLDLESKE